MIKDFLHKIKSIFVQENKDDTFVYYDKSIFSYFTNIRQYLVDDDTNSISIYVEDIVPTKVGKNVEYKKINSHPIVQIKEKIWKVLVINSISAKVKNSKYLIKKFIFNKYKKIVSEKIDSDIFYLMSEMGRVTSSIYIKTSNNFPLLTISKLTTKESLLLKIEECDGILFQLNGIGLKHILVSKCFYDKLKANINNGKILLKNKEISVQLLPEYLEGSNPTCLILSSVDKDNDTPGIVLVHKNPKIKLQNRTINSPKKIVVNYLQEYQIQKCGTNPEFFYLRFYQT
jgi:hypothetical protein